ncbi:MAG: hypothetical protein HY791_23675 [Deltaproteobacteria bacterium]|nr:hypothetical protein [Deltaproteobacteria bacterium]
METASSRRSVLERSGPQARSKAPPRFELRCLGLGTVLISEEWKPGARDELRRTTPALATMRATRVRTPPFAQLSAAGTMAGAVTVHAKALSEGLARARGVTSVSAPASFEMFDGRVAEQLVAVVEVAPGWRTRQRHVLIQQGECVHHLIITVAVGNDQVEEEAIRALSTYSPR